MRKDINLGFFTNERTNKTLIYYPVAKNANSSAKLFLIEHLGLKNKFYFIIFALFHNILIHMHN